MPANTPKHAPSRSHHDAVVIGAGTSGLATAALLRRAGVPVVVLERSGQVGASWRQRYDHLRLHTTRGASKLPGLAVPRQAGAWVGRDDWVRYLERYSAHHRLDVRTHSPVHRVESAPAPHGTRWLVTTADEAFTARAVVVATGRCHTPYVPDWPGRDTFTGELVHAYDYRAPAAYRDKDVLVVGAGNSGTEIAVALARAGAGRVRLAVRTPPNILPRSSSRWHTVGRLSEALLPLAWRDRFSLWTQRTALPDLTAYGLPRPTEGVYTRNARDEVNPVLDHGFAAAVRAGDVEPVAAVERFDGPRVVLADGARVTPQTVIAATGYRTGLDGWLGHLGVLDDHGNPLVRGAQTAPDAPGLYFVGYANPLSGALYRAGVEARAVTRAIRRMPAPVRIPAARRGDRPPGHAYGLPGEHARRDTPTEAAE
ncbi:NAD(P)/FAD-dependent oxidoreductase [Streptomyces longispororuber]|uniref:flavin-containing monooxygenase n=1 Tax=Streptomyces longispororuber TaxID=68230 RepID=UPI00340F2D00